MATNKRKDIKPIRVWVTEFSAAQAPSSGVEALPFAQLPAVNRQYLDVGAGPSETAPLSADTRYVRVVALDEPVLMVCGALAETPPDDPAAWAEDAIVLVRWHVEYFGVESNMVLSFAAVP